MTSDQSLIPPLTDSGDLPPGLFQAPLAVVIGRFGTATSERVAIASRLSRIHALAMSTSQVRRFIVFGSFVTAKRAPNDVDVFLLMEDSFNVDAVSGEARLIFDHVTAQARFGVSIFWLRRLAVFDGEEGAISHWQVKRDGSRRGIIEVMREVPTG